MTSNLLCLNPSKTEFILIDLRAQLEKIPGPSISLNLDSASTHKFTPNSPVRNLGVIFDQSLCFSDNITLPRYCFMHISAAQANMGKNFLETCCSTRLPLLHLTRRLCAE